MMQYELCRHIKTNGLQCKAAALTDGLWCYFHHRLHQRHNTFRHTEATRGYLIPGQHIELTALEDRESVQVALSVVINALATGKLDIKRATALLYGLQLASNNARGLYTEPYASSTVRSIDHSPDGLDLAEPGATVEVETIDDVLNMEDEDEIEGSERWEEHKRVMEMIETMTREANSGTQSSDAAPATVVRSPA
jgi:hypothetical protein